MFQVHRVQHTKSLKAELNSVAESNPAHLRPIGTSRQARVVGENQVMQDPGGHSDVLISILKIMGNCWRISPLVEYVFQFS